MLNQFGKDYKLCSKTVITRVYKEGSLIKRKDVLFRYLVLDAESENKIQFMTSAPKKKFRMAVDRNYVKRILREMIYIRDVLRLYWNGPKDIIALIMRKFS